jgi:hypothetical protein
MPCRLACRVFAVTAIVAGSSAGAHATESTTVRVEVGLVTGATAPGSGRVLVDSPARRCPRLCTIATAPGSVLRLTARPGRGYVFDRWSDSALCPRSEARTCELTVAAEAVELTAFFRAETRTLQVVPAGHAIITSRPAGIDCAVGAGEGERTVCAASFAPGTRVTLTATPEPGSRLVGWSAFECRRANRRCRIRLHDDQTVSALLDPVFVTVRRLGSGGRITSRPRGIDCGPGCDTQTARFQRGTALTVTAEEDAGAPFRRWGEPCGGSIPVCSLSLLTNETVEAAFGVAAPPAAGGIELSPLAARGAPLARTALHWIVRLSPRGRGKGRVLASPPGGRRPGLSCSRPCSRGGYGQRELVTFTAVAARGSRLLRWRNGCGGRRQSCRLPAATHTSVAAVFGL